MEPDSFKPVVHSVNQMVANATPYEHPTATWGQVWWPSQILDRAIKAAHGTTINGGKTRDIHLTGSEWWKGRYMHARGT
jgi:hypothetical protein